MDKKLFTVGGIDEAGRGAVIGPMVIAGATVVPEDAEKLKKLGVKDSKLLSPKRREYLAKKLEGILKDVVVVKISACKIDDYKKRGVNLNKLEAMKMADILDCLDPNKVYIDSPENNTEKFKKMISKMIKGEPEMIVEHKADQTYPIVSAASIIAKVERDAEVKRLHKKYGVEGSGYPSDERTIEWMKSYLKEHGKFPEKELVRFSWDTTKRLLGEKKQKGLGGFLKKVTGK